jgi:hypothetical protein
MDAVLVSLTAVSLGLAIAMGVVLLKVLREERQRSDARVALLTSAAAPPADSLPLRDERALTAFAPERDTEPVRPSMFAPIAETSPWRRRVAIAGACVGLLAAIAFTFGSRTPQPASEQARVGAPQAPLELLSLRDAHEADALTISGVVHNPREGATMSRVVATVFLLGPSGAIVADGRAALDYPSLAPGEESPFVIKIPLTGSVSRYRVGFRGPDGAVIAHVDRRSDAASARDVRNTGSVPPWVR